MESINLSFGSLLRQAWHLTKKHWAYFLGYLFLMGVVLFAGIGAIVALRETSPWILYAIAAVLALVILGMSIGLIAASLKAVRGLPLTYKDAFGHFCKLLSFLSGYVLYTIIVIIGYILLVIPGVVWQLKYMFWPYFVVDQKEGALQSLESSGKATHGYKWDLLALTIVWWLVSYLIMFIPSFVTTLSSGLIASEGEVSHWLGYLGTVGLVVGGAIFAVVLFLVFVIGSLYYAEIYRRLQLAK